MPDLRLKQFINQYVSGRYLKRIKFWENSFSEILRNLAKVEKNCSAKNLESYLIAKLSSRKNFYFLNMAFLNAFLVVFREKREEIKTLNTLLHRNREKSLWRRVNLENILYLSLLDVFSWFYWLCPLQIKHSQVVKENIKKIFAVHVMLETLQLENGKEFSRLENWFCRMKKMQMVQSWACNSRAHGKVEQSHCVLRNKIPFYMVTQTRSGTDWVKNLPNYMKCLNNKKPEELGWQFPF